MSNNKPKYSDLDKSKFIRGTKSEAGDNDGGNTETHAQPNPAPDSNNDASADKPEAKSNNPKKSGKKNKVSASRLKPRALLWDDEHYEMLNELSKKTLVPKQEILRNILNPAIERAYKKFVTQKSDTFMDVLKGKN